jgi:hypothetical protein
LDGLWRLYYAIASRVAVARELTFALIIQAGVGTYFAPGVVSPTFTWLAKILDEAFAWCVNLAEMKIGVA